MIIKEDIDQRLDEIVKLMAVSGPKQPKYWNQILMNHATIMRNQMAIWEKLETLKNDRD